MEDDEQEITNTGLVSFQAPFPLNGTGTEEAGHSQWLQEAGVMVGAYDKNEAVLLRASCLTLEIKEFRCYKAKIEESEKAGSCLESNPGHL